MQDAEPCARLQHPSGWDPGPPAVPCLSPNARPFPLSRRTALPRPERRADRKMSQHHTGRAAPPPARSLSSPLSFPSPSPLCFIAVLRSGRNVIHGASASLEYGEAALKYVLCGRLVGWGLSRCLMGWGELSREEMGETDRSRGNPQRQRQNTEGERVKEIKRETEAEQEADEREETGGRLWVCGHCHALLIFSIFLTGPGQRFTRVYLTHLQHEADKIHIAFVFGSSPELLMETQTGQGPAAAARPPWSPLRCWQPAALSSLQSSWVRVTESGKGPSGSAVCSGWGAA